MPLLVKIEDFTYSTDSICYAENIKIKPKNVIIFFKKFEGNPSTFGRATVLSDKKEIQIILLLMWISQ